VCNVLSPNNKRPNVPCSVLCPRLSVTIICRCKKPLACILLACLLTVLPWRENQRRVSCIPTGVYQCALVNSPRFGRVYEVRNVPGRDHILIHASNLAGDVNKGWVTQVHGCIAPCERLGAIKIPDGRMQKAGLVSRPALRKLMDWAGGKNFTLEVIC